ncbi:MAG TPA: DNA topoisomerase IV subunit A [Microbacteriaceae bacterium]|nr:DNA topoisomerase IV subunit A [Microbacteriaceae bacterium]
MSDDITLSTEYDLSEERIEDIDVSSEMESSFLEYAYSVIYSRALPDARDGLKPVQRRILYMMTEMGLVPEKGHVKSARVVGEVMGKLHPHGDSSIYDALVRLAQSFSMRLPLVDGHGNFGSLDDGPAASRYTEARLTGAALTMTDGLKEDVVDFVPNYDNQLMQPEVLPSLIPNLLVNGASGIAVGMATNLAPHNLQEVVSGAVHLLYNPDASIEDLMQHIPAPDLPGGGTIVGLEGIKDAYTSGRGQFKTRAKVSIEKVTARRTGLVVTELPYLIGPERIIDRIKQGVENKKISGISDVVDLSDRKHGLRMVITLKTGFSAEGVLEQLYKATPLEDSFSINSVALVNGEPRTLSLKEMLRVFLDHRVGVVKRRTEYRLAKRRERLHLVEGMLIAIVDIDAVIQIIRASDDSEQARSRLIQAFEFSVQQTDYILELRLRRLTKFSRIELEAEKDTLLSEISELEAILEDKKLLHNVVATELEDVSEKFGTPRRTTLMGAVAGSAKSTEKPALEIADVPCRVLLSQTGVALRIDLTGNESTTTRPKPSKKVNYHGVIKSEVTTTSRAEIGALLSDGTVIRFTSIDLPVVPETSVSFKAGVPLSAYLSTEVGKNKIVGLTTFEGSKPLGLITKKGVVKRVVLEDLPQRESFEIMNVKDGDEIISVSEASDDAQFVLISSDTQLLHFSCSSVRPQGRAASGMAGMAIKDNSEVIFGTCIKPSDKTRVITVASSDLALPGIDLPSVKISEFSEFPAKGRATGGVRSHRLLKGEDRLFSAWVGDGEAVAVGSDKKRRELPEELGKRDGSGLSSDGEIAYIGQVP